MLRQKGEILEVHTNDFVVIQFSPFFTLKISLFSSLIIVYERQIHILVFSSIYRKEAEKISTFSYEPFWLQIFPSFHIVLMAHNTELQQQQQRVGMFLCCVLLVVRYIPKRKLIYQEEAENDGKFSSSTKAAEILFSLSPLVRKLVVVGLCPCQLR